ncbi:MAG: hypothetical protein VB957_13200 [Pseudomonadales bacterium]
MKHKNNHALSHASNYRAISNTIYNAKTISKTISKVMKAYVFGLLISLPTMLYAGTVIEGDLGDWLVQDAAPKLSEVLTRHPRFKGKAIKVTAMEDGYPIEVSDELTRQIKAQLVESLLSNPEVKIVFGDSNRCQPISVDTVLGIDVNKRSNNRYHVSIAMVDIEEGIWLSGTNISWQGRVTPRQNRAFNTAFSSRVNQRLFSKTQSREISDSLYLQLQCGVEILSPVYFKPGIDGTNSEVLRLLQSRLANNMSTTLNLREAVSVIGIQGKSRQSTGNDFYTLAVTLSTAEDPEQVHRIAEVKITGNTLQLARNNPAIPATSNLLSDIGIVTKNKRDAHCGRRDKHCVDISFKLNEAAYTVLFYSIGGYLEPLNCETPRRQRAGTQRYGLKIPNSNSPLAPSVGFYVLAFRDKAIAGRVNRVLASGAKSCNPHGKRQLTSFTDLLQQNIHRLDWKAIHLSRYNKRIIEL